MESVQTVAGMILDGCKDDNDDLLLIDPTINLPKYQLQELSCLSLVLLRLEFITRFIESACTSLLFTKIYPLLCKCFEAFSETHMRLEYIICE